MLNVEFREINVDDIVRDILVVNGIPDPQSHYYRIMRSSGNAHNILAIFRNSEAIEELQKFAFSEVNTFFARVDSFLCTEWWEGTILTQIDFDKHSEGDNFLMEITLQPKYEHWAKPWSIAELAESIRAIIAEEKFNNIKFYQEDTNIRYGGFGIRILVDNLDVKINKHYIPSLEILRSAVAEANRRLIESANADSVSIFFKFPTEIRTACKQYLVYFAQFLADIGIEANTDLKQKANQTLFIITPTDGEEALSKIQEALTVYLNAPANPAFEVQTLSHNDLAVKQWEANVHHLKGQLLLANAILQAKDATIQAKDATIETLNLKIYQNSQVLTSKKEEKRSEEILDGLVTVKEYEGPGFSVDTAEIFRRLKRKFIKDA